MPFHNFMTFKQKDLYKKLGELMWDDLKIDSRRLLAEGVAFGSSGGGASTTSTLTCETDNKPKNYLSSTEECVTCGDYYYADRNNDACI